MRAALQEIRSTITFHLAVVWLAPPYHTTCTGVSDDVDFKYTWCLRDGPELNPHHPQGETGTVLSLASDSEPTSRLARTAARTCTVPQPRRVCHGPRPEPRPSLRCLRVSQNRTRHDGPWP